MIHPNRIRHLNTKEVGTGPIVYWMGRDQRVHDNWALLYAQQLAKEKNVSLAVMFAMPAKFLNSGLRQYEFAIRGLEEVEQELQKKNIPFYVPLGDVAEQVIAFAEKYKVGAVVADFNPIHMHEQAKKKIGAALPVALFDVDAHNVIPTWISSPKQEFGAYTIRPKIHRLLPEYLEDFPIVKKQTVDWPYSHKPVDWKEVRKSVLADANIIPVDWIIPGEKAAKDAMQHFFAHQFKNYATDRNDPNKQAQSNLSPYLHFGHIAPQRVAYEANQLPPSESSESFLEELIVRRELADNFCFYNSHYDSFEGFPNWAKKTLDEHREDVREFNYSYEELEAGKTHDELWNAAQLEMVYTGKMHNYMRMYWAKKILEWTPSPEVALKYAIELNDSYELDGRDPNGYVGCAWSIGGVHDRAWGEREIFGKIRYMSYNGAKGKFKIKQYVERIDALADKTLF